MNKAVENLEIASDEGNYIAKANLALCYFSGNGKLKDLDKALSLLEEANNYDLLKGNYDAIIEQIKIKIKDEQK